MADESVFRGVLQFFDKIGIYDVVLPFLLVFTMVFAILEKTKVFGTEKIGKEEFTKKNLNAIVAFSIAFLVVASSKLVSIINKMAANIVVLLAVGIFFLMLAGVLVTERKEGFGLEKGWQALFMVIMFIGLAIVALDALPGPGNSNTTLLAWGTNYILNNFTSTAVSSIIFVVAIALLIMYITREPKKKEEEKKA